MRRAALARVYDRLLGRYGARGWWPADTPFEVMVGAILTQNTSWTNVTRALAALRARIPLTARAIVDLPSDELADLLRPVGYFRVKARRLQAFCQWLLAQGGVEGLARQETAALRPALLAVHGVGPETADDMLLYALARPVFVVDAYTRRLFARLGLATGREDYEALRAQIEAALPRELARYQEYHALIVEHGKTTCKSRPLCANCVLRRMCPAAERAPRDS